MTRVAILSDIHGNLHILEKALSICRNMGVARYVVLGDMVSDGPDSQAVLDTIQQLTTDVIRGNREEYILSYHEGLRSLWDGNYQCESLVKAFESITRKGIEYLYSLPNKKRINLYGLDTLLVHGSHSNTKHLILPSENIDVFMEMYEEYECVLFLLGHSHQSFYIQLLDKYFINPGPLGIPQSLSYYKREDSFSMGILNINEETSIFEYENVYIPYDADKLKDYYLKDIDKYMHPFWQELIADSFYTKHYFSLDFLNMAKKMAKEAGFMNIDPIPNDIWDKAAIKWRKEHAGKGLF